MESKISCNIIEDLIPSVADEIASEDTQKLVEEHILGCENCRSKLERMRTQETLGDLDGEVDFVLSDISKIKAGQKKQKFTIRTLSAVSLVLAVCLVISLVPRGLIGGGAGNGTDNVSGNVASNSDGSDVTNVGTEGLLALGIPSEKVLGDYTAASDYGEIYDYFRNIYKENERGWGSIFDYATGGMKEESVAVTEDSAATGSINSSGADIGGASAEFSETNVMTEGVDESDISKTDGNYIYNATGSEVVIFDIRGGVAKEISRIQPSFISPSDIIREMYVDKDLLSLITEHESFSGNSSKGETVVLVYDISDRENPKETGKYRQDGIYHTSRKVGDIIYLFTNNWIADPGKDKKTAISEDKVSAWLPSINGDCISPGCIYLPESGTNSFVISSFNQNKPDRVIDAKVIVNNYVEVYVGNESIYLYNQVYSSNREIMKVSKLKYNDGLITSGASTSVRGHLNDRFAINEHNGYLRMVTTEWDNNVSNMLYVFDSNLIECGRISDIATGEQLYACRFMGDIGYFVTYERTDPLFTVDLTNPQNPEIVGELKILGFSEYLHFWGEGKLLGIGQDADENGRVKGIKLSMFDISDPGNVTEETKLVLKNEDYAPGFYNYKAILASPNANLFGFATVNYDDNGNTDSMYYVYSYENGEFVKRLSEDLEPVDAKNMGVESVRGHFAGNYFYISNSSKVLSIPLN